MYKLPFYYACSGMERPAIKMNDSKLYSTCKASRANVEESHKWKTLVCVCFVL